MKNDFPGQKVLKATYTVQLHLQNINSICSISDKSSPRWCFNMSGSGKLPLKEPQSLLGDVFSDTKKKIHFSILSNHGQSHVLWGLQNQSTFLLEGLLILTFPCDAQCFIPYTCKRPQWMLPVYSSCFVSWCRNMKGFALNSFLIKFSKDSLFLYILHSSETLRGRGKSMLPQWPHITLWYEATTDIGTGQSFAVEGCPVHWGCMAGSLASTHQIPVALLSPSHVHQKCLQPLPSVP